MAEDVAVRKPVPLRTLPGIELAAVGTWRASTGETTFTVEDLAGALSALDCPGVRNPIIKLGHDEEDSTGGVRWDGEPALGWISNMQFDGVKIYGDLTGMPAWLVDADENGMSVLATAYPDRSIEIYRPFRCQIGHQHPSVITALSLLGALPPGVGVLKSLQDVYAAFTVTDGETKTEATALALVTVPIRVTSGEQDGHPVIAGLGILDGVVQSDTDAVGRRPGDHLADAVVRVRLSVDARTAGGADRHLVHASQGKPPLVLRRDPTAVEMAAGTDFTRMQTQWEDKLDELLAEWTDITAAQRDELTAQIEQAVDDGALDRLGDLDVDSATAVALLAAAMREAGADAMAQQIAEARSQGVTIDQPEVDENWLDDLAEAIALTMGTTLAAAAGRNASQLLNPDATGETVARQVGDGIDDLSDRFLRDQLGGALSAAQHAGRVAVLKVAPDASYYASEVLDTNACSPCKSIDGTQFETLDQATAAYGSGKYVSCSGGARCRGQLVTVWDAAVSRASATVPTTVRLSIGA